MVIVAPEGTPRRTTSQSRGDQILGAAGAAGGPNHRQLRRPADGASTREVGRALQILERNCKCGNAKIATPAQQWTTDMPGRAQTPPLGLKRSPLPLGATRSRWAKRRRLSASRKIGRSVT